MIQALILGLCTSAVWFLAASTAARAHHSFAVTFEAKTVSELQGEVMSVAWRNPHVRFTLRATGADGQEVLCACQLPIVGSRVFDRALGREHARRQNDQHQLAFLR